MPLNWIELDYCMYVVLKRTHEEWKVGETQLLRFRQVVVDTSNAFGNCDCGNRAPVQVRSSWSITCGGNYFRKKLKGVKKKFQQKWVKHLEASQMLLSGKAKSETVGQKWRMPKERE